MYGGISAIISKAAWAPLSEAGAAKHKARSTKNDEVKQQAKPKNKTFAGKQLRSEHTIHRCGPQQTVETIPGGPMSWTPPRRTKRPPGEWGPSGERGPAPKHQYIAKYLDTLAGNYQWRRRDQGQHGHRYDLDPGSDWADVAAAVVRLTKAKALRTS